MKNQLWDDGGFKGRIKEASRLRGMTVRQALAAAGVSPYYLKKPVEGRSTNTVLKLAEVLGVPPAEMLGVSTAAAPTLTEAPDIDSEQLRRIMVAARMMAAQLAALVYVASNGAKVDPVALLEIVLREIDGTQHSDSSERDGNKT